MSITPATLDDASLKNNFSPARNLAPVAASFVFPSYFHTLTQFSPQMSPRRSRRNHATKKSLSSQIALSSSELRGV
jgi:hypothetical protein